MPLWSLGSIVRLIPHEGWGVIYVPRFTPLNFRLVGRDFIIDATHSTLVAIWWTLLLIGLGNLLLLVR